jgi:hypothetical protein
MKITECPILILLILGASVIVDHPPSLAQSNPRYVNLGSGALGALYAPDSGVYSHVAVLHSHPTANNLDCGTQWASRGFMALCLNTRYFNNETAIRWETIILDL